MFNNLKRWAGAAVLSGMTLAAGAAHGQDIRCDVGMYQRDQQQANRDAYQLQRDLATGNRWGVQRDLNNLRQDGRDLCQDRQNIQADLQYQAPRYQPSYGGYPSAGGYPSPSFGGYSSPYNAQPAPWGGASYGRGVATMPMGRPW